MIRDEIDACLETPAAVAGRSVRNEPTVAGKVVLVVNVIEPASTETLVVLVVVVFDDVAPA